MLDLNLDITQLPDTIVMNYDGDDGDIDLAKIQQEIDDDIEEFNGNEVSKYVHKCIR